MTLLLVLAGAGTTVPAEPPPKEGISGGGEVIAIRPRDILDMAERRATFDDDEIALIISLL